VLDGYNVCIFAYGQTGLVAASRFLPSWLSRIGGVYASIAWLRRYSHTRHRRDAVSARAPRRCRRDAVAVRPRRYRHDAIDATHALSTQARARPTP